jgi:hypothetical protein
MRISIPLAGRIKLVRRFRTARIIHLVPVLLDSWCGRILTAGTGKNGAANFVSLDSENHVPLPEEPARQQFIGEVEGIGLRCERLGRAPIGHPGDALAFRSSMRRLIRLLTRRARAARSSS